eukprot:scaffold620_cov169-Amphora_coffeaeformis.AAC.12
MTSPNTPTSPHHTLIPWTKGRLSRFIVDFNTRVYQFNVPTDEASMQKRVLNLLYAKNGHYDDGDLIPHHRVDLYPNLYSLFASTVPRLLDVAPPLLRRVTLRLYLLDRDPDNKISLLLERSYLLTQVTFYGYAQHHDRMACALAALAKNQSQKQLRKLVFHEVRILNPTAEAARDIRSALIRLQSLREIQFINSTPDDALDDICEAITCHVGVESVSFRRTPFKLTDTMERCLTSLPNLRSLETQLWTYLPEYVVNTLTRLVLDPSEGRGDNRSSRFFLRYAEKLKKLDLGNSDREVEALFLRADLSKLTQLESIKCGRLTVDYLSTWSQLKHLHCTVGLPVGPSMEPLLGKHCSLKSLKLNLKVEAEILEILRLMETNESIEHLEIKKRSNTGRTVGDSTSEDTVAQLRNTLRNNKTLSSLSFYIDADVVPVFASVLRSNDCVITSLSLGIDRNASNRLIPTNVAELFYVLRDNTTLHSLSLDYDKKRLPSPTWDAMVRAVPVFQLRELKIRCYSSFMPLDQTEQLAEAFNQNTTLTTIEHVNWDTDSDITMLKYISRLFSKRNRINAMSKKHQITPSILPLVLQSISSDPSALFLASEHVTWPETNLTGKRKAHPITAETKSLLLCDPRLSPRIIRPRRNTRRSPN